MIEEAFQAKLAGIAQRNEDAADLVLSTLSPAAAEPTAAEGEASGAEQATSTRHDGHRVKGAGLAAVPADPPLRRAVPSKTRRVRNKLHLEFVSAQPCLICGRRPCDAHHVRFVQPRALGRKVSDEFTVPLCRVHQRQLGQGTVQHSRRQGLRSQRLIL
jgi:hypothetical protein